jgi:arsenite methyltransferase
MKLSSGESCRFFERPILREAGGGLIRPGGLELTQRAIDLSALEPGSVILDMGCGTGATLRYLIESCGLCAFGVDLSTVLLAEGKGRNLPLARASGSHLPFADLAMDGVLAECSLSVMPDVEKALDECARVLKQDGMLLVHDVYARCPYDGASLRELPVRTCLAGAVSKEEWIERLEGRGFAVVVWEDHSQTLKLFAARLIFSHGSLESFWCGSQSGLEMEEGREIQRAVSSARPGYFLIVAKKIGPASRTDCHGHGVSAADEPCGAEDA